MRLNTSSTKRFLVCIHLSTAVSLSSFVLLCPPSLTLTLFLFDFLLPSSFSCFLALPASTKLSDLLGVVRRGSGPAADGEGSTSTPSPTPQTPNIPMQSKYKAGAILNMELYVCVRTWLLCNEHPLYIFAYMEDMEQIYPVRGMSRTNRACLWDFILTLWAAESAAAIMPHFLNVDNMAVLFALPCAIMKLKFDQIGNLK